MNADSIEDSTSLDMVNMKNEEVNMIGVDALVNLADKLGIITAVKDKLIKRPDPAADKLITALEELAKVFEALNSEMSKYLSVTFYDGQEFKERAEERAHLVELEGGQISARMARARGHCRKIINIYDKYLVTWFDNVLSQEESQKMRELFEALAESDAHMIAAIDEVSFWLSRQAEETLNMVDNGEFDKADRKVKKARIEVLSKRKTIAQALTTLFDLQSEFIGISGVV
ncbi:hypothetical protein HJG54_22640 [Leptolyngbya sp. NK1-12]|uniref:Uncharacterized protein n=1 Tax=Leptolyngbya sp. NK1-12 TaxID=2547451 RepID=A0AA96WMX7_9CYAN|nr:hypothetical protein [Leptolyngbya sp. NK1-12]WNZ25371.1 hypothetical protein HJG54_22640 [Leptolyngbya sp. NK1-12]